MADERQKTPTPFIVGKLLGIVFGFIPLGIGVTVLGFLWLTPFNEFGSPPLFFRIFGSFIALGFVAFGFAMCYGAIVGARTLAQSRSIPLDDVNPLTNESASPAGYRCTGCGASLGEKADVSPLGDVKCEHCGCWFNIHGK